MFNPKGIAIIGASPNYFSGGFPFLQSLLAGEYPKEWIFPINPKYDEINGLKSYPSILDVPVSVDYCIIAVPKEKVFKALEECVKKGVKLVCCFTSGFSEIGYVEDEKKLIEIIRKGGTRLLGPNCIGICVPKNRIIFNQGIKAGEEWAGDVGIISQSGGNADAMMIYGTGIGVKFSKAVSYGNGADINADEILEYFKDDDETNVIVQYLEGFKSIEQGRNYLRILKETTKKKPVVIWQGGVTDVGKRSIMSHTGSISGDNRVIKAAFDQNGAIMVKNGGRDLLFTVLLLSKLIKHNKLMKIGRNIGAVLGGGGNNVYFADLCTELGLNFPDFDSETLLKLKKLVGEVGTLLRNPIDLNVKMFDMTIVTQVIKLLNTLDYIDVIVFEPGLDWGIMNLKVMSKLDTSGQVDFEGMMMSNFKRLIRTVKKIEKPFILISAETFYDGDIISKRKEFEDMFRQLDIPVYNNISVMANSIIDATRYKNYLLKTETHT